MPHALRIVWITLHHLCLSASCLDSLLGRSGESRSLDGNLLGHLAVAQDLVAILTLGEDALGQQSLGGDGLTILEGVQRIQVDDLEGLCENVVDAVYH